MLYTYMQPDIFALFSNTVYVDKPFLFLVLSVVYDAFVFYNLPIVLS